SRSRSIASYTTPIPPSPRRRTRWKRSVLAADVMSCPFSVGPGLFPTHPFAGYEHLGIARRHANSPLCHGFLGADDHGLAGLSTEQQAESMPRSGCMERHLGGIRERSGTLQRSL